MFPEPEEDESELTSIMSAEERSLLQESTRGEEVQRPTARPQKAAEPVSPSGSAPRGQAEGAEPSAAVVIPKAPAVPGTAAARSKADATDTPAATGSPASAKGPTPARAAPVAAPAGTNALATVVPFVLLAAAIAAALLRD